METIEELIARIGTDNPPTALELRNARTELGASMKAEAKRDAPDLEILQSFKAAFDTLGAAVAEAETAEAEKQAQIAEMLAGIEEATDAATGDGGDADGDGEDADDVANKALDEKEPVLAGGNVRVLPLSQAAARVKDRPAPIVQAGGGGDPRLSLKFMGQEVAKSPSMDDLVGAFSELTRSPSKGKTTVYSAEVLDVSGNWRLSDEIGKRSAQVDAVTSPEAVAAAGGCCILPEPIRTQTVNGSTATPIRDSLPSFGVATTGAVTFYPPVCEGDASAIWTCEDDAAVDPDDPDTWKQCETLDCDDPVVTTIDAIYRCFTVGEFQRRFDGERWRAFLQHTLISHARLAENHLWSKMRAATGVKWTGNETGSVFVTLVQALGIASETIRQDQRLDSVNLRYWAPGWLLQAIRSDLVARRLVDIDNPVAADQQINQALSNIGINVTWSPDVGPIGAPVSGPVPDFPSVAPGILAPEGHFTYLDGGEFNMGTEIKDFDLTRQNAVGGFAEQFQGLMARGCFSANLDIPVTVCDLAAGCVGGS